MERGRHDRVFAQQHARDTFDAGVVGRRDAGTADIARRTRGQPQRWPQLLPGGKAVLFTSSSAVRLRRRESRGAAAADGRAHGRAARGYHGRYLPSGHLVYIHDGTLFAVPFDLDRLAVTGPPVPALEGVTSNAVTGGAQFAVSASGTLVYLPGQSIGTGIPIHWMDREGKTTPLRATPANWINLLFAPDGRVSPCRSLTGTHDIWVYEWARDTLTRLTSDPAADMKPVWTPDGRRIVFASARADTIDAEPVLAAGRWDRRPRSASRRARTRSSPPRGIRAASSWRSTELNPATNRDLMILPMEGDEASGWKPGTAHGVPQHCRSRNASRCSRRTGAGSRTSRTKPGHDEVYVRPFPGPGGK